MRLTPNVEAGRGNETTFVFECRAKERSCRNSPSTNIERRGICWLRGNEPPLGHKPPSHWFEDRLAGNSPHCIDRCGREDLEPRPHIHLRYSTRQPVKVLNFLPFIVSGKSFTHQLDAALHFESLSHLRFFTIQSLRFDESPHCRFNYCFSSRSRSEFEARIVEMKVNRSLRHAEHLGDLR